MEIIRAAIDMHKHAEHIRQIGKKIAFVPTMGFFHEGHLSLMRKGRKLCDELIISIFVNPTQFGPNEDFDTYPRNFERDLELAQKEGVDIVFAPTDKELYFENFQTYVKLENLSNHLCGLSRPVFFTGVATVVTKLFNIVKPHVAIFGQKDYQQLLIIRQMVRDLNFEIEIVGAPTVRESDGLAMSSRNDYLTPAQRPAALSLYKSLIQAQALVKNGVREVVTILHAVKEQITSHAETEIDYVSLCDPENLIEVESIDRPVIMALAVKVGKTRLIDNMILKP
jgi:pantoate--beta-alanine ligase